MMRRLTTLSAICLALSVNFCSQVTAQVASSKPAAELPVKRVVLYKNGVGYFEHAGRVAGSQELNIQFTTGQLNDVLKSLTVVDLDGGKITGVRYNSIAPLSERLSTLRVRLGEQTTRMDFLNALRGARVEVRNGTGSAVGKLLSVEVSQRQVGKDEILQLPQVAIVTDSGELRTFDLMPSTTVRIAEGELNQEIGRYLNLIGTSRAKDLRRMTISTAGTGDRNVFVSYISEVPVWKSTYRIVLPKDPKQKPLLQGWAIVDNTIGEDWKDVQLSLVAGAPQSFVQQISQPYYVRRPSIGLPESVLLTPQTHEETMIANDAPPVIADKYSALTSCSLWGVVTDTQGAVVAGARVTARNEITGASQTAVTDNAGIYRINNISAGNAALYVEAQGFQRFVLTNVFLGAGRPNEIDARLNVGSTTETVQVNASVATVNTESAELSSVVRSQHVEAFGKEMGDLFQYEMKQKITVLKNQSALVPIINAPIEAEKVTLWSGADKEPLRALWLKNTSGLTVDAGSFDVMEDDSFAGEGVIAQLEPNERRLVSYAADTAIRVDTAQDSETRPVTHVRIAKSIMKITHEERRTTTYTIHNSNGAPREVILEQPAEEGWKIIDGNKPEESTKSFHRFRVSVDAEKSAKFRVEEASPEENEYELSNFTDDQLKLMVKDRWMTPSLEAALRKVLSKKDEVTAAAGTVVLRKQEITRITQEQARLRENMKVLKGSSEERALLQRYVQQLSQQEDRLATLNKEVDTWEAKHNDLSNELDQMVEQITLDETL